MDFQSLWSILLGVLSIVVAIKGILMFINRQLPSNNLQAMFDTLDDADNLLLSCNEEGLVPADAADDFRQKLAWLRAGADETRLQALSAKGYREDLKNWLKGLTRKMSKICEGAKGIRSEISTSSLRERERLAAQRQEREAGGEGAQSSDCSAGHNVLSASSSQELPCSPDLVEPAVQQVAAPPNGAASASLITSEAQEPPAPVAHPVSATVSTRVPRKMPSISMAIRDPTIKHSRPARHSDRRCSLSSNSSRSVRWNRKGDPLSRARAMTTFLRYTRVRQPQGPPVYVVDRQQLAVCELAEDDSDSSDDDWVDELAVRVVA